MIIEFVLIVLIVSLSIFLAIILKDYQVDFGQNVTSVDGTEFDSTFDAKVDDDFAVRFSDLECNDDCSNVSSVKIGNKTLEAGKDYEVKRGSMIIIIFKKVLQTITNGEHDIVVKTEQNGKFITVGVKITITNSAATNEQPEQNNSSENNNSSGDSNSTSQNTPTTNSEPSPSPEPTPVPEPAKTCSELKNCDYNLNDRYIIETDTYNFYSLPEGVSSLCDQDGSGNYYLDISPIITTVTFYQIGNFTGRGGGVVPHVTPTRTQSNYVQADNYAKARNYVSFHQGWGCGGMGDIERDWTWQETIDKGFALDEAKCAAWGLSCGRW